MATLTKLDDTVNAHLGGQLDEFLTEYRTTALKWAAYACLASSLLFLAFSAIAWRSQAAFSPAQYLRLGLSVLLVGLGLALWMRQGVTLGNYVRIAAAGSTLALAGTIVILGLPGQPAQTVAFQAAPSFIFGLFLHYAFLRLPLNLAAAIGWLMSVGAVVWVPEAISGSDIIRHAAYLSFANVFGMTISHLIESRERELFLQRRAAEAARADARIRQTAAENADHQKTRLIAAVSHDLRQPMMAAVAYLDILRRRIDRNDLVGAQEQAEKVQSAVDVLGATLDHLLTAARYDSGAEPVHLELVELAPLMRDLIEGYSSQAASSGVDLRLRLPKRRLILNSDRRSLHRILGNLVSNAIKFGRSTDGRRSSVLVLVRTRLGYCDISVIDNGIGIAPQFADAIWRPYVQLNNVERRREQGLGLGLFLVQRILEQLPGHSVRMRSKVGRGSCFTLTVPGSKLSSDYLLTSQKERNSPLVDLRSLSGAYALLVEDDLDARVAISDLLGEWGVLVASGGNLSEVLELHGDSDRLVDVIICDYRLGDGLNGREAIDRLREQLGYSPHAVLISGEASLDELNAPAPTETKVLQKPFQIDAFSTLLLRAVRAARDLEAD